MNLNLYGSTTTVVVQYSQDIFDSIRDSLLQQGESYYSAIYKEVNKRLSIKSKKHVSISHRDFSSHLDRLAKENTLRRHENPKKKRGTRVYYCLTDRAKKAYQWSILGIDTAKERLRRIYQSLFFIESSKSRIHATNKQLDEFLSNIGASREELMVASGDDVHEGSPDVTKFKPFRDIEITKFFDGNRVFYAIRLPGFSIEELTNYETPTFGNYESNIFCYSKFTREELNKALDLFRETGLIRPIAPILPGESRFAIVDQSLRNLIGSIWEIHKKELSILHSKLFLLGRPLDEDDKSKFLLFYGNKSLNQLYLYSRLAQKAMKRSKNFTRQYVQNTEELNEFTENEINEKIQKLRKKYAQVIQEYSFPIDLIERVCFRKVSLQNENISSA